MSWVIALAVVVLVLLLVASVLGKKLTGISTEYPYTKNPTLFSPAERSFLGVLEQAISQDFRIFGKVRVADVTSVKSMSNKSAWQKAFNRISGKHFDYVICRADDLSIVCAVELDDQSHQRRQRQERDAFLAELCKAISLPLIQIPAQRAYSVVDLHANLMSAIGQPSNPVVQPALQPSAVQTASDLTKAEKVSSPIASTEAKPEEPVLKAVAPSCPKCSGTMVRRTIKSGANAGKEFWGCGAFPKCRGIVPI